MGKHFVDRLSAGEILVADGATATNYQLMGMTIGVAPEEWVFDQPDKVLGLHRAFIVAGSDIILTDTFGATSPRLRESPYAGRTSDLNRRAVALARQAASTRPGVLVAGSMGPTGMLMEPFGELTPAAAADAYAEQAAALTNGGADVLLLETFFAQPEFQAQALVLSLTDTQRALVWRDERLAFILGTGRHALWKMPYVLRVENFDTSALRFKSTISM